VLEDLLVLHHPAKPREKLPAAISGLEWQTCLRRILLLNKSDGAAFVPSLPENSEAYEGKDAYGFLLEVICGLQSPLVGETAVLGQFKEFCAMAKFPQSDWGHFLRQVTCDLLVDAKRVRHGHLEGLGSQSYGGLVRQYLKGVPSVFVLGAGQLAQEILPWLTGKTDVAVFYRKTGRAEDLSRQYPQLRLHQLTAADAHADERETAIVIVAPLAADQIEKWIALQTTPFVKILDLRGDADSDPIHASIPVIRLAELFAALKNDRGKVTAQVSAARTEIRKAVQRLAAQAQFRPFGWEDLCA